MKPSGRKIDTGETGKIVAFAMALKALYKTHGVTMQREGNEFVIRAADCDRSKTHPYARPDHDGTVGDLQVHFGDHRL